jgi:2-hydroxychromene-2-carboxylate isomerase
MREAIDFHFDFLSPFSYLALTQLEGIAARHGRTIAWHPIDLATAKIAAGNTGPGNRDMPVKLAYMRRDLARWAALYQVPFGWAGNYASRRMNSGVFFARQCGMEAAYVRAAFHAGWVESGKLDDPAVLGRVAQSLGWDAAAFLDYVDAPAAATALADSTSAAIARGVFGVPTMFADGEMWWGNDRLFMLEKHLARSR